MSDRMIGVAGASWSAWAAAMVAVGALALATPAQGQWLEVDQRIEITVFDSENGWQIHEESLNVNSQTPMLLHGSIGTSFGGSGGWAEGIAVGNVNFGYMNGVATVNGHFDASIGGQIRNRSSLTFVDQVIINAPGMAGQVGTFSPRVEVNLGGGTSGMFANYAFWSEIGQVFDVFFGEWNPNGFFGDPPPELYSPTIEFVYGQPFLIRMGVDLFAQGEAPFLSGGAFAVLPGSLHWQGISGLADGAYVELGVINWIQPAGIPEPSSALIVFVAMTLGAVITGGRRR